MFIFSQEYDEHETCNRYDLYVEIHADDPRQFLVSKELTLKTNIGYHFVSNW